MTGEFLLNNWALAIASVLSVAIGLFVMHRLYQESGRGRLGECLRELTRARQEAAAAAKSLEKTERRLAGLQKKADSTRPRTLAEAEEAVQDARSMLGITGDKVLRAEKKLRDVILEDFPPNRQDVLRNKYL